MTATASVWIAFEHRDRLPLLDRAELEPQHHGDRLYVLATMSPERPLRLS